MNEHSFENDSEYELSLIYYKETKKRVKISQENSDSEK